MGSTSKLNVIALISGGKDSLFSILHCQANGHEVIALANLYPPPICRNDRHNEENEAANSNLHVDDIDSYMYQTVGHTVIPYYEEALDIPLYRQEIQGSAVNKHKSYWPSPSIGGTAGDETESLVPLLQQVVQAHPEANAVSTGAILSDYQRTRVESVAIRLGLVPLSYLWQFPWLPPGTQRALLDDMAAVGQDVRIVKVSSGGLDESFLWENLVTDRVKRRLATAMGWFGGLGDGALLGEGGEFETLAIDGPPPLWKKRIRIDEGDKEVIGHGGGSALLRFSKVTLVPKMRDVHAATRPVEPRIPALLDQEFANLLQHLEANQSPANEKTLEEGVASLKLVESNWQTANPGVSNAWHFFSGPTEHYISNIVAHEVGGNAKTQMEVIAAELLLRFQQHEIKLGDTVLVTMLLRSIDDFASVNQVYGSLFSKPSPPARITVGCGNCLPAGIDIMLAMVVDVSGGEMLRTLGLPRKGLHVQSRSYWAPANIGPYSQAISVPTGRSSDSRPSRGVYVAGQIPLVPASMELVRSETLDNLDSFRIQTVLSLQHLWRIGKTMDVQWWTGAIVYIAGDENLDEKTRIVSRAWEHIHLPASHIGTDYPEQGEMVDVDLRHQKHILPPLDRQESRHPLPDPSMLKNLGSMPPIPPLFAVQVDQLPRGASVEWAPGLGISNNKTSIGYRAKLNDSVNICYTSWTRRRIIYRGIADRYTNEELEHRLHDMISNDVARGRDGFAIPAGGISHSHSTIYTARPWGVFNPKDTQIIPCRSVWGYTAGTEWGRLAAAVVWHEEESWEPAWLSVSDDHFDENEGSDC